VVVLANIFPDSLRVVALQRRGEELITLRACNLQPEPLGRFCVSVLVDADAEGQVCGWSPGRIEESQEESDQRRVAVREDHALVAPMRLALEPSHQ